MALVVVELTAKAECVDALRKLVVEALPDTRAYDGCHGVTGFLNDNGRTLALHEQWTSKAHHERYLAWRIETGALEEAVALCEESPNIRYFEPVDV